MELNAGYYEALSAVNINGKVLEAIVYKFNKGSVLRSKEKVKIKEYNYNIYNY